MSEVDILREEILSFGTAREALEARLQAFEDAVRRQEHEETLASIRHSLNTLRSLVAFLRQEVEHCSRPLEKLCDELERNLVGSVTHSRPAEPEA